MKTKGYKVELVTEWAKEAVYEQRLNTLTQNQLYVLAKQDHRLRRLYGNVDVVITDSPLPLSIVYAPTKGPFAEDWFKDAVLGTWRSYENINVEVIRTKEYHTYGRTQTYEEAKEKDREIHNLMQALTFHEATLRVEGDKEAPYDTLEWIERRGLIVPPL